MGPEAKKLFQEAKDMLARAPASSLLQMPAICMHCCSEGLDRQRGLAEVLRRSMGRACKQPSRPTAAGCTSVRRRGNPSGQCGR